VALAASAGAFLVALTILYPDHRHTLSSIALGMAACHCVLGVISRRRVRSDVRSHFAFIALAVAFATIAVPLRFKLYPLTLLWAVEGPLLLYLGYRFAYRPVRMFAFLVLELTVARVFVVHCPPDGTEALFGTRLAVAMCVPLAGGIFAAIHHWWRKNADKIDVFQKIVAAIVAGLVAIILLHLEFDELFHRASYTGPSPRLYVPVLLWTLGAVAYMAVGMKLHSPVARISGVLVLGVAFICGASAYTDGSGYVVLLNARFGLCMLTVLTAFLFGGAFRRVGSEDERTLGTGLHIVGGMALLALLSTETYQYVKMTVGNREKALQAAQMALSIVWGGYAAAVLAFGFWRRLRPVRFAALLLFAATALKLVFVDLASLEQIYRIMSFVALGLLMIGASYVYHRVEKMIEPASRG